MADCSPTPIQWPIQFRADRQAVDLIQLRDLFNRAAFWAADRQLDQLALALDHSSPVISAWHDRQMVGLARATSDRVYRATIWDVVVDPRFQGAGVGRQLVETALAHPHLSQVERVYLMTTHQQRFRPQVKPQVKSQVKSQVKPQVKPQVNSNSKFKTLGPCHARPSGGPELKRRAQSESPPG
jgi:N-acetylglutamate synthase-like GNAT family acetyltransferase